MPHKCVKCGNEYEEGSPALMNGCGNCGSRVFVFHKPNQETQVNATREDVEALEKELAPFTKTKSVSIQVGVENVTVLEKGLYELDIKSLMKGDPLVVKTDKEVYFVRFPAIKRKTNE